MGVLVLIALTSTAWTKKLFGRGTEEEISFSQLPFLDQLNSLVVVLLDFQYMICFYATNGGNWYTAFGASPLHSFPKNKLRKT